MESNKILKYEISLYICVLAKAASSPWNCYAFRNTQLSSKIEPDLENSEVHICIRKMERSAYDNEYNKIYSIPMTALWCPAFSNHD